MNELQQELTQQIKKYCQDNIEPVIEKDDEEGKFRKEIFQGFGKLGIAGITLPEQYGGAGLSCCDLAISLEEIAKSSVPYAVTLSVSTMVQAIINDFGTEEQKQKYLPELTSGSEIGAFALSETHAGSDAASLKTTAKKVDGGYELNGNKFWISTAGEAKTYIVMARTGGDGAKGVSAFIVENGTPGLSFGKCEQKIGWKTSPTREVILEKCFISEKNLLAGEGEGFKIAMSALDKGRITIAAIAVGCAKRCLDEAIKYSMERKQFNQAIFNFQGIQWMIADLATETKAAELMVHEAAKNYDENNINPKLAAMTKLKATDTAMKVSTDCVQILGGVGLTTEYPVERFMRDAKPLQVVEGTNQIQKIVIAKHISKEYGQ